jgi:hypothetical protein
MMMMIGKLTTTSQRIWPVMGFELWGFSSLFLFSLPCSILLLVSIYAKDYLSASLSFSQLFLFSLYIIIIIIILFIMRWDGFWVYANSIKESRHHNHINNYKSPSSLDLTFPSLYGVIDCWPFDYQCWFFFLFYII